MKLMMDIRVDLIAAARLFDCARMAAASLPSAEAAAVVEVLAAGSARLTAAVDDIAALRSAMDSPLEVTP